MRRLFWTFPDGLPGTGLLLMRLAIAGALFSRCLSYEPIDLSLSSALWLAERLSAVLLLAGLATPICAVLAAAAELWRAQAGAGVLVHVLAATIGAALALLGPGAFSVDARLFGWRRIDVRPPASKESQDDSN